MTNQAAEVLSPQDNEDTKEATENLKPDKPFWDADIVLPDSDYQFQRDIRGDFENFFRKIDDSAWISPPGTENQSYTSIGDQGTTASMNSYGEIIQLGSYLGVRAPGMFVVDQSFEQLPEPYMATSRAEELESLSRERIASRSQSTFGLDLSEIPLEKPKLSYLGYRWPRYEYRTEAFELVIQWMVRDGVILQQCLLTNLWSEDVDVPFMFRNPEGSMIIRDLDYLDGNNHFNDQMEGYSYSVGPDGYSWCALHKFPAKDQNDDDNKEQTKQEEIAEGAPSGGVAIIVSFFLNGAAITLSSRDPRWQHTLKGNTAGGPLSSSSIMEVVCS
jgi:hypothetical protein